MADLWVRVCPTWGALVHKPSRPHTLSLGALPLRARLWAAEDALRGRTAATTRESWYFSPIPSTTTIPTDHYL
jgi:hypothetical protein